VHVTLNGRRNVSDQVYRQLRDAILSGRLRAAEALPSSREFARQIGISRNTVLLVYDRLRSEGFVTSRVGAGTFVREGIRPRAPIGPTASPLRPRLIWDEIPEGRDLSAPRPEFDLRPGIPDVTGFPFAAWRSRVSRQFYLSAVGSGGHIGAAGHPGLRAAIARHVGVARNVRATVDDVFVTNGTQQALDLIARVMLAPGDTVAVEDPCYPLASRAFHAYGCHVVGVPVDADGMIVDAIPRGVRLAYVTPSHQYPLGMAMSMERRQALLEWAREADASIVEDDYDSEFRFGARSVEPLQSLDGSGRVIYVGSFSKVMFSTLRLGFLIAPHSLHSALRKAKNVTDWHTTVPLQAATELFMDDGLLAQHIRRMRRVYSERHELVQEILRRHFPDRLTPLPTVGGLHLTALLRGRRGAVDLAIAENAWTLGVAIMPLSYHYLSTRRRPGFLIGYGAIATDRIEEGLRRFRHCL
jgi:GntR family transcriptional regulator/MocR family aminotransferase